MHCLGPLFLVFQKPFPVDVFRLSGYGRGNEHRGVSLHIQDAQPKVSMLVLEMEAKYHKKATETTRFICRDGRLIQAAIQYSVSRGQPQTCKAYTVGIDKEGNCIAEFWITWSFKSKQ
jgi:hypothetical protein